MGVYDGTSKINKKNMMNSVAAWIINHLEFVCLWFPSWSSYKQLDVKHIMIYFDYIAHQTHLFEVLNESTVFLFNIKKKKNSSKYKQIGCHTYQDLF